MKTVSIPNVHIGNNIRIIRDIQGIKQTVLAEGLGITQAAISHLEQSETIEEEKLNRIAEILKVSPEIIKYFNKDSVINNYFNKENQTMINNNYHPLEKVSELYEKLLQEEREKNKQLEKLLKEAQGKK